MLRAEYRDVRGEGELLLRLSDRRERQMPAKRPLNVLFLCTGNSARSAMAESILAKIGQGRFRAYSAGSQPTGKTNPFALALLAERGYPIADLRSKSWDEFARPDAPKMDAIVTVCDNAAGEVCPVWPGHPATAHWGFPDPAAVAGNEGEKRAAFADVFAMIHERLDALVALPVEDLPPPDLARRMRALASDQAK